MKKKTLIIYIIVTLLILTTFILLTVFDKKESANKKQSLGSINIIYDDDNILTQEELESMEGDEGVPSEEDIPLICNVSDKNNYIIGSDFLPFIAQISYHDKLTSYLLDCGYSGEIDLVVLDSTVFKANQFYYYSFQITDSNEIISCSFDEITLEFEMNIY